MAQSDYFFEIQGLLLEGGAAVFTGDSDPSAALVDLPKGSIYLRTDGTVWVKNGDLASQWSNLATSTASNQNTNFDFGTFDAPNDLSMICTTAIDYTVDLGTF